ncbi:MAG: hypothetical protein M3250_01795 [Thermoproteota archaeon]|nr:hypothetical protein [Thermoproteota archaeon]
MFIITLTKIISTLFLLQSSWGQKLSSLSIIDNMREGNLTTTSIANHMLKSKNDTKDYIFSKNRSEISTPENNTHKDEFGKGVDIALVKPTFTAAAYDNSFYTFYRIYSNVPAGTNVTTGLNLLSTKVTNKTTASVSSAYTMIYLII